MDIQSTHEGVEEDDLLFHLVEFLGSDRFVLDFLGISQQN
jgi:hypothetical protein